MAKKYKRTAAASQARPAAAAAVESGDKPAAMFARRGTAADFNPDYTYIANDLKRIGIISGAFFVILVALSFILPLIQR